MLGTAFRDALDILNRNWLKIIGMVLLIYFIKIILSTSPLQSAISIRFDPIAIATSESLSTILIGAFINSILFFALIHYITLTKNTMKNRFLTAIAYSFRHPRLLYKGFFVLAITNFLLYFFKMLFLYSGIAAFAIFAAGLNERTWILILVFLLVYFLIIWILLGISQAMYILHDDPKIGLFRSILNSFSLMKGHKWSLIWLFVLTGVGLIIGVLLFVIGAVISLVLYEVVRLAFYQELLRKKRQKEWHAKVNE